MKRLLTMLFISLGVVLTSQAQGVVEVQNDEGEQVFNPYQIDNQLEIVVANANLELTKIVSFEYEENPQADSVIIITNSNAVAEVIENEIQVKHRVVSKNGLKHYIISNSIDRQILKERLLLATTNGSVNTHRVRYLS